MEERGNPIDALRGRGEQTILWEARISERIADNNNRRFCFCYRKQPQTLKKLNILLLASALATLPTNSLVRRERNIYSVGNRNWGNYRGLLFGCLLNEDIPIQGIFHHCTYGYNGLYNVHSGGARDYVRRGIRHRGSKGHRKVSREEKQHVNVISTDYTLSSKHTQKDCADSSVFTTALDCSKCNLCEDNMSKKSDPTTGGAPRLESAHQEPEHADVSKKWAARLVSSCCRAGDDI